MYVGVRSTVPPLHVSIAGELTFAATLYFLVYFGTFPIYFCNHSDAPDISTKSLANINPDNIYPPTFTPCSVATIDTIRSLINTLRKVDDNEFHCAIPR